MFADEPCVAVSLVLICAASKHTLNYCSLCLCNHRGILGAHNLTVGDNCKLYLGLTGTIRTTEFTGDPGVYRFNRLTVAADGEVTHLPGADVTEQNLTIIVSWNQRSVQ